MTAQDITAKPAQDSLNNSFLKYTSHTMKINELYKLKK